MIVDSKPKPINDPASIAYKREIQQNEKLAMARDISLDYKVNKHKEVKIRTLMTMGLGKCIVNDC